MSDKLATIYIWITILACAGAIAVMLAVGNPKKGESLPEEEKQENTQEQPGFYAEGDDLAENSLQVLLPAETEKQHVTIESDYRNKTIRIQIAKQPEAVLTEEYFYQNPVRYCAALQDMEIEEDENTITLWAEFASGFEWEMKFEEQAGERYLNIQLVRPRDKYEKIVVLDAGHGGTDDGNVIRGEDETIILSEKELAFSVVGKAGGLLEKEGVQVYYTRCAEDNPSDEERVSLANEVQADMFISVHLDSSEDTSLYGMRTIYNETYFIPDFASADLAYLLLEKVAASTNEKAIGFEPASGESVLIQNAMVPVTQLNIGYLSNRQEQKLLEREDYVQRIAEGICEAVLAGYEEIEK